MVHIPNRMVENLLVLIRIVRLVGIIYDILDTSKDFGDYLIKDKHPISYYKNLKS